MTARLLVGAAAVLVLGWLGVMERDLRVQMPGGHRSAARAESDLRAARFLNPDTAPDLERALLYYNTRRPRQAIALLEDMTRREPDNVVAWVALYRLSSARDPATARRALDAWRRLDPLDAPRR